MTTTPQRRRIARAERLDREASNCVAQAVTEHGKDYAATLIDEAIRLKTRATELAATPVNERNAPRRRDNSG